MHNSIRHDTFYNFSSGVINVKNKEKKICSPISQGYQATLSDAHRFTPQVLRQMEESYITLEDSSFGLNFREVSEAIILNLFWVGFHGIAHRILCSLYKSFTSDVIKLSQKKRISDSKSFSVYTFMKLHKRGKFYKYSICACYVKNFQSFTY